MSVGTVRDQLQQERPSSLVHAGKEDVVAGSASKASLISQSREVPRWLCVDVVNWGHSMTVWPGIMTPLYKLQ